MTEKLLERLWDEQLRLTRQFTEIDKENGLLLDDNIPLNLETKQGQYQLRYTAWCYTEEMCEAHQEVFGTSKQQVEMVDALHFLIETCLFAGLSAVEIETRLALPMNKLFGADDLDLGRGAWQFRDRCFNSVLHMGFAMNRLRNKPWKQDNYPLLYEDRDMLHHHLAVALRFFGLAWQAIGGTEKSLRQTYLGKADLNQRRIDAGA